MNSPFGCVILFVLRAVAASLTQDSTFALPADDLRTSSRAESRRHPDVEIQIARERWKGTARVVEPSDPDYNRLWKIVNDNNHDRYRAYQKQTARACPVIVVRPT